MQLDQYLSLLFRAVRDHFDFGMSNGESICNVNFGFLFKAPTRALVQKLILWDSTIQALALNVSYHFFYITLEHIILY